ncbi:MAG: aldo/keto reductase [Halobacteria archaeon]|nr:aldo/keto reductase [Halobacteria archaeon]
MEYTTLGNTGIEVSKICLGCMSFGSSEWRDWVLDEDESIPIIERAIDLGINFFDTANMYSVGESERVVGKALEGREEESVLATKVYFQMNDDNPNSGGLSRKTIEQELDASLERLGMDTIDLYQTHRWDYDTPIEQTLRVLDDAVRRGKVRHIGASSMWSYQFSEEMKSTTRGETDTYMHQHPYPDGGGRTINERVQELAEDKGVTMAQISLSWLFHKDWVDSPIVGTTSVEHLEEAVEALDIKLSDGDIEYLEEPYEPVRVSGHT